MSKHNYPKQRKPRRTEYSATWKILNILGEEKLFEIWSSRGHRATAKYLTELLGIYVTPGIMLHIAARKFHWKRIITDKALSIYKAVLSGRVSPSVYKTIIFQDKGGEV